MVRTAHTSALDSATLAAARSLLDEVFAGELTDDDWEHSLGGIHALAYEDDELVGHASVIQRRLLHGGRALRAGYVEGVGVRADARRRGHAGAMMGALEAVIRGAYDVGALGATDAAIPLYEQRGWRPWAGPLSALTPSGIVRTRDEEGSVYVLAGRRPGPERRADVRLARRRRVVSAAYLVISHQYPEQVLRLARTLRAGSPDATLLMHHDDRRVALDAAALRALGGVELVTPPTAVAWGWTSQLDMLLRCFAWALERVGFDWLVVLSGQDYPIRPLADIERDLRDGDYDGYLEGIPVAPPAWSRGEADEFARRYFYRYRRVRPPGAALRRAVAAARPLLTLREMPWGTVLGRRCAGPPLPVRRGADWLTLSRRAVEVVVGAAPEVVRHYRRTLMPTESLPHTVLYAEPGLRLSGDTRRYSAWAPGSSHPPCCGAADLDALLASGTDFARKFDPTVDASVMDELDRVVAA